MFFIRGVVKLSQKTWLNCTNRTHMRTNNKNQQGTIRAQGTKNFEECLDALKLSFLQTGYSVLGITEKKLGS